MYESEMIKKGNNVINKIECYRDKYGRLPDSLIEVNIESFEELCLIYYYQKQDSIHYTISFGLSLGESKIYYSDAQAWEDFYRKMGD
jgi:hypothetical protein